MAHDLKCHAPGLEISMGLCPVLNVNLGLEISMGLWLEMSYSRVVDER